MSVEKLIKLCAKTHNLMLQSSSFFILYFIVLIYLVVLALSCITCDLSLWGMDSIVAAGRFSCPAACGILFPCEGWNPHPLHGKVDS